MPFKTKRNLKARFHETSFSLDFKRKRFEWGNLFF